MKDWQWGMMMMVLCNIAYHVSGQDIMPLIAGTLFMLAGCYLSFMKRDKENNA